MITFLRSQVILTEIELRKVLSERLNLEPKIDPISVKQDIYHRTIVN